MNRFIILLALAMGFVGTVSAQNVVRYPVYESVRVPETVCHNVVVNSEPNVAGIVIGSVVGYAIGREIDRSHRGYYGHNYGRHYRDPYYGRYYRDDYRYRHYDSRVGRVGGAVAGGVIGSQVGRRQNVQQVCEATSYRYTEQLIGYNVVTTYQNGTTRKRFEPVR